MLRALDRESALGREVFALIDQGNFVPDEMIAAVVAERLSAPDARAGVLLDGFPRTLEQLPMYDELSKRLRRQGAFVGLRVPEEVAVERLLARGEGRADDSPDVIKKRIEVYHQLTGPLVSELERQGRLSWVDGTLAPARVGSFLVALREGYTQARQLEDSRSVASPLLDR